MKEIFKTIEGFTDYQISNYGNIKSTKTTLKGVTRERILKAGKHQSGYKAASLYYNGYHKTAYPHKLVAAYFKGFKPEEKQNFIKHTDGNKENNHVDNLELVPYGNLPWMNPPSNNNYRGVYYNKKNRKFTSSIWGKGKLKFLGSFTSEIKAHNAYQTALKLR
jgi:hypothetical protein